MSSKFIASMQSFYEEIAFFYIFYFSHHYSLSPSISHQVLFILSTVYGSSSFASQHLHYHHLCQSQCHLLPKLLQWPQYWPPDLYSAPFLSIFHTSAKIDLLKTGTVSFILLSHFSSCHT